MAPQRPIEAIPPVGDPEAIYAPVVRPTANVRAYDAIPETVLAYAAGLLDGEGSFQVRVSESIGHPVIAVNMTDRGAIEFLHRSFGGHIGGPYTDTRSNRLPCFHWVVQGAQALAVAEVLLRWLRVKHAAAETLLESRPANFRAYVTQAESILGLLTAELGVLGNDPSATDVDIENMSLRVARESMRAARAIRKAVREARK